MYLQGISISKAAAEPEINLPSSITISRVDSEIQIVEEHIKPGPPLLPAQPRLPGTTVITRGGQVRPGSRGARGVNMRGRGPPVFRQNIMGRGMINTRGGFYSSVLICQNISQDMMTCYTFLCYFNLFSPTTKYQIERVIKLIIL